MYFAVQCKETPTEPLCDSTKPKPGNDELVNLEVDFLLLQTYLDSIIPLWKVCPLLLLLLRDQLRLMRRQPSSHGARELWAKIERYVLLVLVE